MAVYHRVYDACFMDLPVSSFVSHLSLQNINYQFAVVLCDGFPMFITGVSSVAGLIPEAVLTVFLVCNTV